MPSNENLDLKEQARQEARSLLSQSESFLKMNRDEQMAMYQDVVNAEYNKLLNEQNSGGKLSQGKQVSQAMVAGVSGSNERYQNERIDQAGELAADFIDDVNFPDFVSDLLEGVFDANLNVTVKQMEAYQELLKTATKSLTEFVKGVGDEEAFGYLAENSSNEFSMVFPDDGGDTPQLADTQGEPVDIGDNEVKAKIMDAKLALAAERRALLRETILMGISRLVVEKGTVKAAVVFDVKASEKIDRSDRAMVQTSKERAGSVNASTSPVFRLFGGGGGGSSTTKKKSKIRVSSAKSTASTELAAQITGSVEIQFKSDYFKLDNFAATLGGGNQGQNQGQNQQQLPPQQ